MDRHQDPYVSVYPEFTIKKDKEQAVRDLIDLIISRAKNEVGTIIFTAAYCENRLFLRESYVGIGGFKAHLEGVSDLLVDFFAMLELEHLSIIVPAHEEDAMKQLIQEMGMAASVFVIEAGFAS